MELETLEVIKSIAVRVYIYEEKKFAMPELLIYGKVKKAEYKACKKILRECEMRYDYPNYVWDYHYLSSACKDIKSGSAKNFEDVIEQRKNEIKRLNDKFNLKQLFGI